MTKVQRLIDAITRKIESGEWPPGHKLPSGRQLCEQYDVSMQTVRTAIERLKAAGLIVTAPGAGVFVAERGSNSGKAVTFSD